MSGKLVSPRSRLFPTRFYWGSRDGHFSHGQRQVAVHLVAETDGVLAHGSGLIPEQPPGRGGLVLAVLLMRACERAKGRAAPGARPRHPAPVADGRVQRGFLPVITRFPWGRDRMKAVVAVARSLEALP